MCRVCGGGGGCSEAADAGGATHTHSTRAPRSPRAGWQKVSAKPVSRANHSHTKPRRTREERNTPHPTTLSHNAHHIAHLYTSSHKTRTIRERHGITASRPQRAAHRHVLASRGTPTPTCTTGDARGHGAWRGPAACTTRVGTYTLYTRRVSPLDPSGRRLHTALRRTTFLCKVRRSSAPTTPAPAAAAPPASSAWLECRRPPPNPPSSSAPPWTCGVRGTFASRW